jgi:hypothetical protein
MSSAPMAVLDCSLFDILRHELGIDFPVVRCTKATLVHLSHTLEDLVLRHRIRRFVKSGAKWLARHPNCAKA